MNYWMTESVNEWVNELVLIVEWVTETHLFAQSSFRRYILDIIDGNTRYIYIYIYIYILELSCHVTCCVLLLKSKSVPHNAAASRFIWMVFRCNFYIGSLRSPHSINAVNNILNGHNLGYTVYLYCVVKNQFVFFVCVTYLHFKSWGKW